MISFVPQAPLMHRIECPCRRWEWRELAAALVIERRCPRCKFSYLLVFRMVTNPEKPGLPTFRFLHALKFNHSDANGIRMQLRNARRLNDDEIDLVMHVLEQLAVPA